MFMKMYTADKNAFLLSWSGKFEMKYLSLAVSYMRFRVCNDVNNKLRADGLLGNILTLVSTFYWQKWQRNMYEISIILLFFQRGTNFISFRKNSSEKLQSINVSMMGDTQ